MRNTQKTSTQTLVMGAVLTALVVILQLLASFVKGPVFSLTLVLIPIVIGTATCGKWVGAWLGFVFGFVVLISGDAALFMAANFPGTIITVLAKGTLCGLISGLAFDIAQKLFKNNTYLSTVIAALVSPIINTGIFLLGCLVFFMPLISQWASGGDVIQYIFITMIGANFFIELVLNIVFSPIIVRILKAIKK